MTDNVPNRFSIRPDQDIAFPDWMTGGGGYPLQLLRMAVTRQLLDVVHQAAELPLRIDFSLPSRRKAVELFVVPDVAEHRCPGGKAPPVAFKQAH